MSDEGTPGPAREARAALAAYAHEAWAGWMRYLFNCSTLNGNGSVTIPPSSVARWQRQMTTPYAELPPNEQASDLAEADKMLAIMAASQRAMLSPITPQERAYWEQWAADALRLWPDTPAARIIPRLLTALTACEGREAVKNDELCRAEAERDRARAERDSAETVASHWRAERDDARDEAAQLRDQLEMAQAHIDVLQWGLDAAARAQVLATQPPLPDPTAPRQLGLLEDAS